MSHLEHAQKNRRVSMRISDTTYNRIKWFALAFIPAFEVLILTVGKIWGLPYYSEIGATVAALGVFLAAVIGVSSKNYYEDLEEMTEEEYLNLYYGDESEEEAES